MINFCNLNHKYDKQFPCVQFQVTIKIYFISYVFKPYLTCKKFSFVSVGHEI